MPPSNRIRPAVTMAVTAARAAAPRKTLQTPRMQRHNPVRQAPWVPMPLPKVLNQKLTRVATKQLPAKDPKQEALRDRMQRQPQNKPARPVLKVHPLPGLWMVRIRRRQGAWEEKMVRRPLPVRQPATARGSALNTKIPNTAQARITGRPGRRREQIMTAVPCRPALVLREPAPG